MNRQPLNILLICNRPEQGGDANTILDHIDAFDTFSENTVSLYSGFSCIPKHLDLNRFDVIIIHYSICLFGNHYLDKQAKARLADAKALKLVFIQDEYRRIDEIHAQLNHMKIDVLYTCVPEPEIEKVYPKAKLPNLRKVNTLTGFVPEQLLGRHFPTMQERHIDVGYRARKIPYWLGELSTEKWMIVDKFLRAAKNYDLRCDLSYKESQRIYGDKWLGFLSSCKATLGVESGASVFDFTGKLEHAVNRYQALHPTATFTEVQEKFFLAEEGKIHLNQISPRCFEAIACKTAMVLYEGDYSGILIPWQHYIPLQKDFGNIEDVVSFLRDDAKLQQLVERAYQEIALNEEYTYEYFIRKVDDVISAEFAARNKNIVAAPYTQNDFQDIINSIQQHRKLKKTIRKMISRTWRLLPLQLRQTILTFLNPLLGR